MVVSNHVDQFWFDPSLIGYDVDDYGDGCDDDDGGGGHDGDDDYDDENFDSVLV